MGALSVSDDTIGTGRFLWRMATYRTGSYVSDTILWIAFYASRLLPGLVAQRAFDSLQHGTADVGAVLDEGGEADLLEGVGVPVVHSHQIVDDLNHPLRAGRDVAIGRNFAAGL